MALKDETLTVSGSSDELELTLHPEVEVTVMEGKILVIGKIGRMGKIIQGTTRQLIVGMIQGVSQGWSKTLEVVGTGYRAALESNKLVLSLGFSHKIEVEPKDGISFQVMENKITVSGADKAKVGNVAAQIRQLRPPDAYKGKGIRYLGERVRLKPGKATKVGAAVGK